MLSTSIYMSLAVSQSHGQVYLQGTGSMAVTWEERRIESGGTETICQTNSFSQWGSVDNA